MSNKPSKIAINGIALFFIAFLLYGISLFGGFVQDDLPAVQLNPNMGKVEMLWKVWKEPYFYSGPIDGLYRPVTSFSYYLNGFITGYDAWGFRLVNVLLYAWVCWLVYEALKIFCGEKNNWCKSLPLWFGILFMVLPVHSEAVNNIVGRAELLSLGFLLLSVKLLHENRLEKSAMAFFLSLLSKENAIVGVAVLIYLSLINTSNKFRKGSAILVYLIATTIFLILRFSILGNDNFKHSATLVENPLKFMKTEQRVLNAVSLIPLGIEKILFPLHLNYDYSFNQIKPITSWFDFRALSGMLLIVLSIGSLFTRLKDDKVWIVGNGLFWGSLLVTGNFIFAAQNVFGERRMMWPSLGLIFMILSFVMKMNNILLRKWFVITLIIISIIFTIRTEIRNTNWLSEEKLFIHDALSAKDSVKAQVNLAHAYIVLGQPENAKLALENAERILPVNYQTEFHWGKYYELIGEKEEAKIRYQKCLLIAPGFEDCQKGLDLFK